MGFFDSDLSFPTFRTERMRHKRRRLVQGPNSYFLEVRCKSCKQSNIVYSHATSHVRCQGCSTVISRPTGGKALLATGCTFRRKADS